MIIQQWEWFPGGMSAVPAGSYVRHADHVAAVADERARIKALIASLEYDGDYCKVLHSCDLLTAIDGDADA